MNRWWPTLDWGLAFMIWADLALGPRDQKPAANLWRLWIVRQFPWKLCRIVTHGGCEPGRLGTTRLATRPFNPKQPWKHQPSYPASIRQITHSQRRRNEGPPGHRALPWIGNGVGGTNIKVSPLTCALKVGGGGQILPSPHLFLQDISNMAACSATYFAIPA